MITKKTHLIKNLFQFPKLTLPNKESGTLTNFSHLFHSSNIFAVSNVLLSDVLGGFL
jgi:hypothetical protein